MRPMATAMLLLLAMVCLSMLSHAAAAAALISTDSSSSQQQQRPLLLPLDSTHASSFNLIDILAHSPQHTVFIRLLQRSRLLPTLNNLMLFGDPTRGITILAPTNQAFLNHPDHKQWATLAGMRFDSLTLDEVEQDADDIDLNSNSNEILRQRLFYHVLNFTLPYTNASQQSLPPNPVLHPTLHFPSRHLFDPTQPTDLTRPGPIPHPPAPPFMPGKDPDALLGAQGQMLRVAAVNISASSSDDGGDAAGPATKPALTFGSDHRGQGGVVALSEDWSSSSGVVISLNGVLDLPPKLEDVIHTHPSLSSLSALFPPKTLHSLSLTPHLTLFAPSSPAFDSNLSKVERSYLFDPRWAQARGDRFKLLGWHSVSQGVDGSSKEGVIYGEDLRRQQNSTLLTILGGRVEVTFDRAADKLRVGSSEVLEEDIIIENGVIHLVSELLLPYPALGLGLTVEKTFLGLNASKFVNLMREAELEDYLTAPVSPLLLLANGTSAHVAEGEDKGAYTFVVPRDDFLSVSAWSNSLPKDKKKLRDVLRYHIAPGALYPQNLSADTLVGTELRDWRLKDGRQRVPVSVGEEDGVLRRGNGDVSFGGVNVISDPVKVGSSLIYLTSAFLTPPSNPIQTAVSSLELSTFVAAVFSAHLDSGLKRAPGITYLVPSNAAFENMGLVMLYLLSGTKGEQLAAVSHRLHGGSRSRSHGEAEDDDGGGGGVLTPRDELRSVIEFHAVDSIVYLQDFPAPPRSNRTTGRGGESIPVAWTRYPTLLDGSHVWAGRDANGTIRIRRNSPPGVSGELRGGGPPAYVSKSHWSGRGGGGVVALPASGDPLLGPDDQNDAILKKGDMLTNTGVIHEISRVELPETLDITIGKLMVGAKAGTMIELVRKAGYGWILNGSTPTNTFDDEDDLLDTEGILNSKRSRNKRRKKERRRHKRRHDMFRDEKQAYILLCPTDAAFSKFNLTKYVVEEDRQALKRLVQLHIVPLSADAANKVGGMKEGSYGGLLLPLALDDHLALPSLLDKQLGGASSYGSVAFRRVPAAAAATAASAVSGQFVGDGGPGKGGGGARKPGTGDPPPGSGGSDSPGLGWMVGVRGTRGSENGRKHVARVVGFGRENLGLVRRGRPSSSSQSQQVRGSSSDIRGTSDGGGGEDVLLPYPSMRIAGGVLTLDAVLEEYHPSWWYVWGWLVALCLCGAAVFGLIGLGFWRFWMKDGKIRLPDALDGEED
ncbi:hypothetical protein V8E36_003446 [Tilletia maclaganii]